MARSFKASRAERYRPIGRLAQVDARRNLPRVAGDHQSMRHSISGLLVTTLIALRARERLGHAIKRAATVAGLCVVCSSAPAQVFKCERDGSTVYQQQPCEGRPGKEIDATPNSMDAAGSRQRAPLTRSRPQSSVPASSGPVQVHPTEVMQAASAAGWKQIAPAAASPSDFSPRTRDVIDFIRTGRTPAEFAHAERPVGIFFRWPVNEIPKEALSILERERGQFDRTGLQAAICRNGFVLQSKVQVVRLSVGQGIPLPVFLAPDATALNYYEVSLDVGTYPVLLQVTSYDSAAVRVTTSPQTRLVGVQLSSYHPSVVLGVDPNIVSTRYDHGAGLPKCQSSGILAKDVAGVVPHRIESPSRAAVGEPQPVRSLPPTVGQFVDYDAPAASSYGMAVLEHLGYVRAVRVQGLPGSRYMEVLKRFRMPEGLAGAHSVSFIVTPGGPIPSGNPRHSTIWQRVPEAPEK